MENDWRFLRTLKLELPYDPAVPFHIQKKTWFKDTCITLFGAALLTLAKIWKQPKCPLTKEWIKKMGYTYTMQYYSVIKRMK